MSRPSHLIRQLCFAALPVAVLCSALISRAVDTHPPDKLVLQPVSYKEVPGWREDDYNEPLAAFIKSCQAFIKMGDTDSTGQGVLRGPVTVWKTVCHEAAMVPAGDPALARQFFETFFAPFRATNNGNRTGLFTGYYEPLLHGSRTQRRPYVYPVYGLPEAGTPAYTREQIDRGALNGHAPVLAYVDDPVARFFLHVQGSGRIALDTGGRIDVGYAGSNGLNYRSIGEILVDRGIFKKEDVTMAGLREWLHDHPNDMWQVMWENPSYIFFAERPGDPVGTEQAPLTAGRSLAVDQSFIPLGSPVFVDTELPATPQAPLTIHRKLLIAQDTGTAIHGPVRGDIFFGFGENAEQLAGRMKAPGEMILLVPRSLAITLNGPGS
jgi:membrane-bound lytic murein transglycosylase A